MGDGEESLVSSTPGVAKRSKDQTWVQCDRCTKWRRIPQVLADSLDEDAHWCAHFSPSWMFAQQLHLPAASCMLALSCVFQLKLRCINTCLLCCYLCRYCEHNPHKEFASCNIPQELSNEEIDKQLAESEVCCCIKTLSFQTRR